MLSKMSEGTNEGLSLQDLSSEGNTDQKWHFFKTRLILFISPESLI